LPKLWQFVQELAGTNAFVSVFGSVGIACAGPEAREPSRSEQGKIVRRDISAIVPTMPRHRDRFSMALCAVLASGSACSCARDPAGKSVAAQDDGARERVLNVGNPSRGIGDQPDYDREARALRDRIAPRLPDPLPNAHEACTAMLAAASQLYVVTEVDATDQRAALRATHDADLRACEAQTSPAAASCVQLLLDDQAGEWPWLLDQCSRAFPRS
jgi:hypothetical protein